MHLFFCGTQRKFSPLKSLESKEIEATKVNIFEKDEDTIKAFRAALRENTRLVVIIYGSNVTGQILPLAKIVEIAHEKNILVYSDMAQTAGFLPTDVTALDVDFAAFAGHKSLLGPTGVGFLYCKEEGLLRPLKVGGTGSNSASPYQPLDYPAALESGTLNLVGIGGLKAGIDYLKKQGEEKVFRHETSLTRHFIREVKKIPKVILYGPDENTLRLPVIS